MTSTDDKSPPTDKPGPAPPADKQSADTQPADKQQPAPRTKKNHLRVWGRRLFVVLAIAGVIALLVVAMLPKAVPVEFATAKEGPLTVTIDERARTRVKDRYVVSAPLAGNLARIELEPGNEVKGQQVLARIVPSKAPLLDERNQRQAEARVAAAQAAKRQASAQVLRAKAALTYAEKQAKRQQELYEKGATTSSELESVELQKRTAKADLTSAQFGVHVADYELRMAQAAVGRTRHPEAKSSLEQLEVPSPITGRVLRVMQQSEGVVAAGTPLLEVGDPSALEIVVELLTADAVRVHKGAKVTIKRWGGEDLPGRVRLVEPSGFTRVSSLGVEEQRVRTIVEISAPYKEWKALGDGYQVEVSIVEWDSKKVLTVPTSAVFRRGGGWACFVESESHAKLTSVEIGRRTGVAVQVLEGLTAGDRVILHPSDRVEDGVLIRSL